MDGVSFKADLLEGIHLCLGFHLGVGRWEGYD